MYKQLHLHTRSRESVQVYYPGDNRYKSTENLSKSLGSKHLQMYNGYELRI